MPSRLAVCVAVAAAAAVLAGPGPAGANLYDQQDYLSGGAPVGKRKFNIFNWNSTSRSTVAFPSKHKPGTIVINTAQRHLYLVIDAHTALRYGIGVGRDGFRWSGVKTVTMKREWPGWTPPPQMLKRQPGLPRFMPGGIDNPLGARALYLGDSLYRIHGSNEPDTIGEAVSSGCFRMTNDDVIDLYNRVKVGATVIVR